MPFPIGDTRSTGSSTAARAARLRAFCALALVVAGYVIARETDAAPAALWWAIACAGAAVGGATRGATCRAGLAVGVVACAAGWFEYRVERVPSDRLDALVAGSPADASGAWLVTIEGAVSEPPEPMPPPRDALADFARFTTRQGVVFEVRVSHAITNRGAARATGSVRVLLAGADIVDAPRVGERVRLTGSFTTPPAPRNPGAVDGRRWASAQNEAGRLIVPSADLVGPAESTGPAMDNARRAIDQALARVRSGARSALAAATGADDESEAGAVLSAVLLGQREGPGWHAANERFVRIGAAHLLAVSGFHMGVLAGLTLLLVRLTGERGRAEAWIVAAVVVLALLVVPARAPAVRAGAMVLALCAGEAAGRRYDRLSVVAWVAVAIAIARPMELFSLGYQLSFGVVAALIAWAAPIHRALCRPRVLTGADADFDRGPGRRAWEAFVALCVASVVAWLVATPVVACHTGLVSVIAPVAAVILGPVTALMLWVGVLALMVASIAPPLAAPMGAAVDWLGHVMVALAVAIESVPGAWVMAPAFSVTTTVLVLIAAGAWLHVRRARAWAPWALTLAAALAVSLEWRATTGPGPGAAMRVDMLAVGDGTCVLVRAGGDTLLWDAGSLASSVGVRELPRALAALDVARIDTAIITHPNLDHYNALPDVAARVPIGRVLVTEAMRRRADANPRGAEAALFTLLQDLDVRTGTLIAGDEIEIGGSLLRVLWPEATSAPAPGVVVRTPSANDASAVALLETPTREGLRRVLLTGDIGRAAIARVLSLHPELDADVIEAPHHGSAEPAAIAMLERMAPAVVLQSTGPSRLDDARWDRARSRIGRWLVTARDGAVFATIRRDGTIIAGPSVRLRP